MSEYKRSVYSCYTLQYTHSSFKALNREIKPVSEYKRSGYSCWLALSLLARALPAFDSLLYAGNHLNSIYPTFLRTFLMYRIFFAIAKFYVNHHTSSLILDNEDVWWKKKICLFAKSIQKTWQRLEKYLESSVLIKFYEIACESIFYLEQLSPLAIQLSLSMLLTKIHSISFLKENVPLKWLDIAYLQHVSSR